MDEARDWELGRRVRYFNGTLKKLRMERGLTQKDIADAVGISTTTVSHYETLRIVPPRDVAEKIAKFLDVNVEQVFPEFLDLLKSRVPRKTDEYAEISTLAIEDYTNNTLKLQAENEDPEKMFMDVDRKQIVARALGALSDREQKIVRMYFGLGGEKRHSCEEIAALFCISKGRINQLLHKALNKMRKFDDIIELAEGEGIKQEDEYVIYTTCDLPGFYVKLKSDFKDIDDDNIVVLEDGYRTRPEAMRRATELINKYGVNWEKAQVEEVKK